MTAEQLPRGRHRLTRDQVATDQRGRIITATAEAMADLGYAKTPVAEIIRRAGVSRETFYQLFSSKQDCFVAAHQTAIDVLVQAVAPALSEDAEPLAKFDRLLRDYLDAVVEDPPLFRLFLVESYAAGPDAARARATALQRIVDALHHLFAQRLDRPTCEAVMGAVISLVTLRLATGELDSIAPIRPTIVALVATLLS